MVPDCHSPGATSSPIPTPSFPFGSRSGSTLPVDIFNKNRAPSADDEDEERECQGRGCGRGARSARPVRSCVYVCSRAGSLKDSLFRRSSAAYLHPSVSVQPVCMYIHIRLCVRSVNLCYLRLADREDTLIAAAPFNTYVLCFSGRTRVSGSGYDAHSDLWR